MQNILSISTAFGHTSVQLPPGRTTIPPPLTAADSDSIWSTYPCQSPPSAIPIKERVTNKPKLHTRLIRPATQSSRGRLPI